MPKQIFTATGFIFLALALTAFAANKQQTKVKPSKKQGASFTQKQTKETTKQVASLRRSADAAFRTGEFEKALADLLKAKSIAPTNADVLFEFAMVALRLSLYEDAAQALSTALKRRPAEPMFIYGLARAQIGRAKMQEAEELFRKYVVLKPEDASGHFGLGHVLAILKKNAEAKQAFERSFALQPAQTEAPYQLGLLAYAEGEFGTAREWFEKVLGRYADHAGALLGMGLVNYSNREFEQARQNLERAIALDSSVMKAHYYLGLTLARLGDKEGATREMALAAEMEREQKQSSKIILKLLENPPADSESLPVGGEKKP